MKKIVHVIHCCNIGGAELFAKNLSICMKNKFPNYEIEVWAIYSSETLYGSSNNSMYEKQFVNELRENGINVVIMDKKDGLFNRVKLISRIRKAYRDFKPQVLFCHLETVTFHVLCSLFFKKAKIYEVIHTDNIKYVFLHKYFFNLRVHKYISISKKVDNTILKKINCSRNKKTLIYNGIDTNRFVVDRKFNNNRNIKIVAIGRLVEVKNHVLILEAIKLLNRDKDIENINIELKIYGDGILKTSLNKYIEENELNNCFVMGSTSDVSNILKSSDIYVLSSNREGFSISLIEAFSSGIAIICTNVGGNSEIIKNGITGIIISKNNVKELAASLKKLIINNNIRKRFYEECRKNVDKYSIINTAKAYDRLCD